MHTSFWLFFTQHMNNLYILDLAYEGYLYGMVRTENALSIYSSKW